MKLYKKYLLSFFAWLIGYADVFAQAEMADTMRQEGKIYVVVGIILIVLIGLIVYLYILDKKVKRLEDHLKEKQTK